MLQRAWTVQPKCHLWPIKGSAQDLEEIITSMHHSNDSCRALTYSLFLGPIPSRALTCDHLQCLWPASCLRSELGMVEVLRRMPVREQLICWSQCIFIPCPRKLAAYRNQYCAQHVAGKLFPNSNTVAAFGLEAIMEPNSRLKTASNPRDYLHEPQPLLIHQPLPLFYNGKNLWPVWAFEWQKRDTLPCVSLESFELRRLFRKELRIEGE